MSKEREYLNPRTIFGAGALTHLAPEAAKLGLKKVALFTTKGAVNRGVVKKIEDQLKEKGISVAVFTEIEAEPSVATAERASSFVKETGAGGVIGLGGGSILDVSKAAAAAATNNGLGACAGISTMRNPALPLILIPTTSGTGSEATTVSVLIDNAGKKFVIYSKYLLPDLAIIDPELTHSMPQDVTVHTAMDAMCHAVESYLSVNSSKVSEATALTAIALLSKNLPLVCKNPDDKTARHDMSLGAHLAGVAMTNSGAEINGCPIAGAGITHAVGLATGARYGLPHGLSVGMVLPYAMESLKDTSKDRLEAIGVAMGVGPSADGAIMRVKEIIKESGMKKSLRECGKDAAPDIENLVTDSLAAKRLLGNCSKEIGDKEMREVVAKIL